MGSLFSQPQAAATTPATQPAAAAPPATTCPECKCPECKCAPPDYDTDCPKKGFYKPTDILSGDALTMAFDKCMTTIANSAPTEADQANLNKLLYDYAAFKLTSKSDMTVDDVIENCMYSAFKFCEAAIPSGVYNLSKAWYWDYKTDFKSATQNECNSPDPAESTKLVNLSNTVYTLMEGVYAFIVGATIYTFYEDQSKAANDTTKIFGKWTLDGTTPSQSKWEDVMIKHIKPKIDKLWRRLCITFWYPRMLDIDDTKDGRALKANILKYCISHQSQITPTLTDQNLKCLMTVLIFYDIVNNKKIQDTEKKNACSACFMRYYLKNIILQPNKDKKFLEGTLAALEGCKGLLLDNQWKWSSVNPEKFKVKFLTVAGSFIRDVDGKDPNTNVEQPRVLTFTTKSGFVNNKLSEEEETNFFTIIIVMIAIMVVIYVMQNLIINTSNSANGLDIYGNPIRI